MTGKTVEIPPPVLDDTGRPIPSKTWSTGYGWTEETKAYEHDSILVKFGTLSRIIHNLDSRFNFAWLSEGGKTFVKILSVKSGFVLRTLTADFAAADVNVVRTVLLPSLGRLKKKDHVYKVAVKRLVLPMEQWNEKFKPNKARFTYSTSPDTQVQSIIEMMAPVPFHDITGVFPTNCISMAHKWIREQRALPSEIQGACAEVYAIWMDYLPYVDAVLPTFKLFRPIFYNMNVVSSVDELKKVPL
jgi:hypothetical protein